CPQVTAAEIATSTAGERDSLRSPCSQARKNPADLYPFGIAGRPCPKDPKLARRCSRQTEHASIADGCRVRKGHSHAKGLVASGNARRRSAWVQRLLYGQRNVQRREN